MTIEEDIKRGIELGLITNKLEPIKCGKCGSSEYKDEPTDYIDNLVVEKERVCDKCENVMGIWSYGYWQP